MRTIERLLARARELQNGANGRYMIGFVEWRPERQCFTASGTVWDGKPGTGGEHFYSEHESMTAAQNACNAIAAQYPGADNITFFIDYGESEVQPNGQNQ